MPAISTSSKVLLTGGSGFVGAWILKELLERGFKVRAAVRSESKAAYLRNVFKDHSDNLEFVIIEDIATPGAFDEAVKGVNGIIHTASPLSKFGLDTDAKSAVAPAVQGTVGILKSAQQSLDVKRIIITSSVSAQMDFGKPQPVTFTENDWNDASVTTLEQLGKDAPPFIKYAASKTLAERAAWEIVNETGSQFDLVAVAPTFIWGQIISETTSNITGSNTRLLDLLKKDAQANIKQENLLDEFPIMDVRDAAKIHVDALVSPAAGGQRLTASAGTITTQHIHDILNAKPVEGLEVIRGEPDILKDWVPKMSFSNQKSKDVLGMEYRSVEDTVRDTVIHALAIGWEQ